MSNDAQLIEGSSETLADSFDAEVNVGGWLSKLTKVAEKAGALAGAAYATYQAADGSKVKATPDAVKKAAEMLGKARSGDKEAQAKVEGVAAEADKGDPASKQATTLLSVINDFLKLQEKKGGTGTTPAVGAEFDVEQHFGELDTDNYDWGWPE